MKKKKTKHTFKYYSSIEDMPIRSWQKLLQTNDLTWIMHKQLPCNPEQLEILKKSLNGMTAQYINTFGINDTYHEILKLKSQILWHQIDVALGEKTSGVFVEIFSAQLKERFA